MAFVIESRQLEDIVVLTPNIHRDDRGFFVEAFHADQFKALGLPSTFVQDNHSCSHKGVLRGLHFQWQPAMGKLMRVTRGTAFLVAVDIRPGSPNLGKWFGLEVSAQNMKQIWAPAGFARGFCALTEDVEVQYKCTGVYNGAAESAIRWNDPDVGIEWPLKAVHLSAKDSGAQTLREWLASPESEELTYEPQALLSL
jgi:dTDP-4-dehydrorhamnose 3,5-epimerase